MPISSPQTALPSGTVLFAPSSVEGSRLILGVVVLAAIGTAALFVVSLVAYRRRRSLQYGLITAAIGALLVRSGVGAGTVLGAVPMPVHHLLEHALDLLVAIVLLLAVYLGRDDPSV